MPVARGAANRGRVPRRLRLRLRLSQRRARSDGTRDLGTLSLGRARDSRVVVKAAGSRSVARLMRYGFSSACPPIALTNGIAMSTLRSPLVSTAGLTHASTSCLSGTRPRAVPPTPGAGKAEDEQAPTAAAQEEPVSTGEQLQSGSVHDRPWYPDR